MTVLDTSHWHIARYTYAIAGTVTTFSVASAYIFAAPLLLVPALVIGCAQIVYAFTGFCVGVRIMETLGVSKE